METFERDKLNGRKNRILGSKILIVQLGRTATKKNNKKQMLKWNIKRKHELKKQQ